MTYKEAADILDPKTTREALRPYDYDPQRRLQVVNDACELAAKALKAELQAVKNTHIKIQYHNEELTIREICERLERAEKAKHSLIAFLNGLCMACVKRYDCNTRKGSHKRCWKFDYFLIGED